MSESDKLVQLVSKKRVFPENRPSKSQRVSLSWIDAVCARFSPASAAWFFNPHEHFLSLESLEASLQRVLDHYPHWCGQLEWDDKSFKKVALSFGSVSDPGIALIHAECSLPMSEVAPSYEQRCQDKLWQFRSDLDLANIAAETLAMQDLFSETPGLPPGIIQITKFSCGGVCISIKLAHLLSDAETLALFIQNWGRLNQNPHQPLPTECLPIFQPDLLDRLVPSDDKMSDQNLEILSKLPMHGYDFWASRAPSCPDFIIPATIPPAHAFPLKKDYGNPPPWETWDMTKPTKANYFHLSKHEIAQLLKLCKGGANGAKISHLDAVCAAFWAGVCQAKRMSAFALKPSEISPQDLQFHFGFIIGIRSKVEPPLPPTFTGTPTIIVNASMSINQNFEELSQVAPLIRATIQKLTPTAIVAYMHSVATSDSPQRYWNAFLGNIHTTCTSWVRSGSYEVTFAPGMYPVYVLPAMPNTDGSMCINESAASSQYTTPNTDDDACSWSAPGVTVRLCLEVEAMKHFVVYFDKLRQTLARA